MFKNLLKENFILLDGGFGTELIKKGYKITAIYGLCGYNDFSTFYRNFKKIMGVSPDIYKKSQKNKSSQ